jgi:geranyl-CoA carboxylase alpha subunit
MITPIKKVLVANRGEIAVRILRTVRNTGFRSVAVFSDADAGAPHTLAADQAVRIGPAPVAQSYLSIAAIIAAARSVGADAVHPGYGFLSENSDFAAACAGAGLVFIGPSPESIHVMGDKRLAKERMIAAGVPCIPGYTAADQSEGVMREAAANIGYPVMIKASAGGGGRGIRLVHTEAELKTAMRSAASEARNAFGDGTLYLEKAVFGARHIEVQVIADSHGTVLHLGERDCSAQRRNQKVIEEAPSAALSAKLRQRICEDAVAAARSIDYLGVGTVEFLLDQEGQHYFLEMNTRLQVEHAVTEMITKLDLVELQLRVAQGLPLGLAQADIRFHGHSFEARLYTEDPAENFAPRTGKITRWRPASGPHVRVDAGIAEGQVITPFYDPMVAKIITWGETREDARRRLDRALADTVLSGVVSNRGYLGRLVNDPRFLAGTVTTDYLNAQTALCEVPEPPALMKAVAAVLLCWPQDMPMDRWMRGGVGQWAIVMEGSPETVTVTRGLSGEAGISFGETRVDLKPIDRAGGVFRFRVGDMLETVQYCLCPNGVDLAWNGFDARFTEPEVDLGNKSAGGNGNLLAPMSASVVNVMVAVGDRVEARQTLFVLEAMKMEIEIIAEISGVVASVGVGVGQQVSAQQLLAEIREPSL